MARNVDATHAEEHDSDHRSNLDPPMNLMRKPIGVLRSVLFLAIELERTRRSRASLATADLLEQPRR